MSFPFCGQQFTFTQPDGGRIEVRGWGDQNHAIFETLDGFTVVRDPVTGFYNYATVTAEHDELRSSGVRVDRASPVALNFPANARVKPAAARVLAQARVGLLKPRWMERHQQRKAIARAFSTGAAILPGPPPRQTVGDYVGLCLLIQFPDVKGTITQNQVDAFCNAPGYSEFGNNGSVYDYYLENSANKLSYKTIVAPYYTARHSRDYYTQRTVTFGERARDLIKEALAFHRGNGFDFSALTADSQDAVYATNVFYAGPNVNNWAEGLWPHSSRLAAPYPLAPGIDAVDYQITNMGNALTLGTYCHENGHMLCDFPDLYNYADQRRGVGDFCLMCLGGNADPRNPAQIGAYLKYRAGWADPLTPISAGMNATATAGKNQFFIHARNEREYFIVENRNRSGRDTALTDSGLAIWRVDELGSNSNPESSPTDHRRFECVLVQADGRTDLELGANSGDASDLFRAGLNDHFSAATTPSSNWWDGTPSQLEIHGVGAAGAQINFKANV